jgi:hypothetical protein
MIEKLDGATGIPKECMSATVDGRAETSPTFGEGVVSCSIGGAAGSVSVVSRHALGTGMMPSAQMPVVNATR